MEFDVGFSSEGVFKAVDNLSVNGLRIPTKRRNSAGFLETDAGLPIVFP